MKSSPSDQGSLFALLFSPRTRSVWGLLLLALFLCFFRLGAVPLFDLDEALYVTSARQMILRQDVVTPRLNSRPPDRPHEETSPFFEKPILVYWLAAASMRTFGMSEGAARVPVALAAFLTTGLLMVMGTRWFGRRAGLLAGLVYITAPLTMVDARQMTTDGLLVFWFTLALFSYRDLQEIRRSDLPLSPLRRLLPVFVFWTACALAILTKGAIGLLLPALVISVSLFFNRKSKPENREPFWATVRSLRPLSGILLLLLLAAPWHIAVWQAGARDARGATFVEEYLFRQHIGRFRGGDKVHNAPLPTYILYFLVGFFPWACFAPAAFRARTTHFTMEQIEDTEREKKQKWEGRSVGAEGTETPSQPHNALPAALNSEESRRFLLIWFWTIFLFFSLSAAKLPTYIAPAYPAAALLVGRWLAMAVDSEKAKRALLWGTTAVVVTAGLLFATSMLAPRFTPKSSPIPADVIQLAKGLTLTLLVGGAIAWGCFRFGGAKRGNLAGVAALVVTMVLFLTGGITVGYGIARHQLMEPYQNLAQNASPQAARGVPIIYYHIIPRRPSMLFYATYSPYERKETPLLPFLQKQLPEAPEIVVITSRKTLDTELLPELRGASDFQWRLLETAGDPRGGWVSIQIRRK